MSILKPTVLRFESLPSTNTELARLASEGEPEGVSVVADEQTAGRGRLQRAWSSPKGAGLYFSLLLRPTIPQNYWPLITFMAAIAVGDALREAAALETDIKWPNDLLSGERKICGILAEAMDTPAGRAVILGIGINLTQSAFPPELENVATSVAEASGRPVEREQILAALLDALSRWSCPAQNARPLPARTITRTTGSASSARNAVSRFARGAQTLRKVGWTGRRAHCTSCWLKRGVLNKVPRQSIGQVRSR